MENYVAILQEIGDGCTYGVADVLMGICLKSEVEIKLKQIIVEEYRVPKENIDIQIIEADGNGTIFYDIHLINNGIKKNIYSLSSSVLFYSKPICDFAV